MVATGTQRELIFDIGMHRGLDTKFYLDKGFRVVALEANPSLVAGARTKFSEQIANEQLVVVDRALWHEPEKSISFYVNPVKDDWSSAIKGWAEKGGHQAEEIRVQTTTLSDMFDSYGVPYYIKCDIEGADDLFTRQLLADKRRPAFISVEAMSLDLLALLFGAGYDRVQIVNQSLHWAVVSPQPALEGGYVDVKFNGHMSGLFGRELNPKAWISFETAAQMYLDFMRLRRQDDKLANGWLDFHVTRTQHLADLSWPTPSLLATP